MSDINETTEKKTNSNARIAELEAQLATVMTMLAALTKQTSTPDVNPLTKTVTIVHLYERSPGLHTHLSLSNRDIDMDKFGEVRTFDLREAEELIGKYRWLFEQGILALGNNCDDIASRFNLDTISSYKYSDSQFVARLAHMNNQEIEEIYSSVADGTKQFMVEYFKRKYLEKDPSFYDIHKIELLNRLSDGGMSDILSDVARDAVLRRS